MSEKPDNRNKSKIQEGGHFPSRSPADILDLPDSLCQLVSWMMRQSQVCFAEIIAHTGQDEETVRRMLETLITQGFVQEVTGSSDYRARLGSKSQRQHSQRLWQMLDEKLQE